MTPLYIHHYKIEATDGRGIARVREFTIIARDEVEAQQEMEAVFSIYDAIKSWQVSKILAIEELSPDDAFANDYAAKGAHSYHEPL